MELYKIVNTEIKDLHFIYSLFEEGMSYQKRKGYPVWAGYDKEVLEKEIKTKQQYKIVVSNTIACIFSICYSDPLIWREKEKGDAIYLHRIAVNPSYKGQKLFGRILKWCTAYATQRKVRYLRMDTWADNPGLVTYYESFGFQVVGKLTTPDSEELPIPQRNNKVVLLEFTIEDSGPDSNKPGETTGLL